MSGKMLALVGGWFILLIGSCVLVFYAFADVGSSIIAAANHARPSRGTTARAPRRHARPRRGRA